MRKGPPIRKRWGQHFLIDPNTIERIVATIDPQPNDEFLEIGPGHGELTLPLAKSAKRVTAVDIDPMLIDDLSQRAPDNLELVQSDILKVDLDALLAEGCRVYGSLPFNISSQIFFRLLEFQDRWRDGYFIIQKEVAERMVSDHGSKTFGRLSVMIQARAKVSIVLDLPPTVFHPRPLVASTMVKIVPSTADLSSENRRIFETIVRAAFGQRRKKMSNALKVLDVRDLLEELELVDLRAEHIAVGQYIALAKRMAAISMS